MSLNARHGTTFKQEATSKPTWLDEIGAVIVCLIGLPVIIVLHFMRKK